MEFPHLGNHCSNQNCNKLDFLPIKCDACGKIFCNEHFHYTTHNCTDAYKKDNQVPVCPLCNVPIPVGNQPPDSAVGAHMDNDCQSDPAKNRRRVFTNKCSKKGCKIKEVIPVLCNDCSMNFCLKHRHPVDHSCQGKFSRQNKHILNKEGQTCRTQSANLIQGNMSEDEALARALALSMEDNGQNMKLTQEELDLALARQLQAAESQTTVGGSRSTRDRCHIA
ncbi:hypothetical protein Trydic_g7436 [Trypoxylus dichotomus]